MDYEPRAPDGDGLGELTSSFNDLLIGHADGGWIEEDLSAKGRMARQGL